MSRLPGASSADGASNQPRAVDGVEVLVAGEPTRLGSLTSPWERRRRTGPGLKRHSRSTAEELRVTPGAARKISDRGG